MEVVLSEASLRGYERASVGRGCCAHRRSDDANIVMAGSAAVMHGDPT
jgi:hypothetical protein